MTNWKKTFGIIWTGQFLSILTSMIVNFAIILWLSFETRSAEVLAFGSIAALLPQTVLGFFVGVFIDRWNRKKVMMLSDSFIAFCTLILAVLFYFGAAQIWHIYILLALRSVGSAFHMPAMEASVPLIAPESQLMRIAGINQMIHSAGSIAGPALGALFITMMDIGYVLLFDVAGAVFAVVSLMFVHIPNPPKNETAINIRNVWNEMKAGVKVVISQSGMKYLFLFSVIATFCIMPVSVLFPLMTLDHFGGNAYQMSLIEAIWGVGALFGGAVLGVRKFEVNKVILINAMYLTLGLSFLLSGLLPANAFYMFVILTSFGGVAGAVYSSSFTAIIQEKIDPAILGRIFSMFMSVSLLPAMIGLLGTGFMADTIGLTTTFVIMGGIICLIGIISFFIPSLMTLDKKSV